MGSLPIGRIAGLAMAGGLFLALAGAWAITRLEERDAFCAGCHLRPEVTYVMRAAQAAAGRAGDLAAAHAAAGIPCVGCHRGDASFPQRALALALGAGNALRTPWVPPDTPQHPVRLPALPEASCRRCHVREPARGGVPPGKPNPVLAPGFENHFHTDLFRPDLRTSVRCIDCHPAHRESVEAFFIDRAVVIPACERCHQEVGRGPLRMGP